MTKTVILRDRGGECELCPLLDGPTLDQARVIRGTVGHAGDIVRKPSDLTWTEATEELAGGRTVLSPFDLELEVDAVTEFAFLPEGGLESLFRLSEAASLSDSAGDEEGMRQALTRLASQLEASEPQERITLRRRKTDAA